MFYISKVIEFAKFFQILGLILFIFVFSIINSKNVHNKILPMTGFKQRNSVIGSSQPANWAITTAQ